MSVWNISAASSWFRLRMILLIIFLIAPTIAPIASVAQARQIQTSDVAIVTTENGEPFYDACFVLLDYSIEGCDMNRDGKITFEDIPLGSYTLRQTRDLGPGRHVPDSTITVTGNVASDGWERFNAFVVASGTSGVDDGSGVIDIALITRDPQDGGLLTGTCYVLLDFSNEGCDENGDGQVTFAAIPYGDYTVRQTLTPSGYPTIDDYTITVGPVRGLPGGSVDVPLGFVVKQAPEQNAPGTRNISVVLIDATTRDKVVAGACVELVGASLVGCDEDLLDGQIDFLGVREGGPYELRFSNLLPGTNARTIDGANNVTIEAGPDAPSHQLIFVLLEDQSAGASIVPIDSADVADVVGDSGFLIELDGVTVSGAPDVAPSGTAVQAHLVTHDLSEDVGEFAEPVGTGVEVILGDGVQPSSPITITFAPEEAETWLTTSDSNDDLLPVVFTTAVDGTGMELADAELLPDGSVVVSADHLSRFQPALVSIDSFLEWFGDQLLIFMQVRGNRPDCVDLPEEDLGWKFSNVENQLVWPCLEETSGGLDVTLTNNSPEVWIIESEQASPGFSFSLSLIGSTIAQIAKEELNQETTAPLIPPDGTITFTADETHERIVFDFSLNASLTVVNALVSVVSEFIPTKYIELIGRAECLLDVISTSIDISSKENEFEDPVLGGLAGTVARCLGTIIKGFGGKLISILATIPGAATAVIDTIVRQMTNRDEFSITLSSFDDFSDAREETGTSNVGWPTDRDDSVQGLYTWIGASSVWPDTGISGMPDWVACDDAGDYCLLGYNGADHVLVEIDGFDIVGTIADWYPDPKEALLILGMTEEVANQILGID